MKVIELARFYADLHIHSRYSAATSGRMNLEEVEFYAAIKGLSIVGTGDALHKLWLKELKSRLVEANGSGLFRIGEGGSILFLVQTEVATVHEHMGKTRRIHHVVLMPSLDVAEDVRERLSGYGDLDSDGRPVFKMKPAELVEILLETSRDIVVFPAHVWTPWWGVFGAISGVERMEECYEDMVKHIHALETGLSCYDEETEVLTKDGWKRISEATFSDEIYTLNLKTGVIELQRPIHLYKYRYKGKMYRLKTKKVDLLVTPNHRILYSPCDFRKPPSFRLKEARLLFNRPKRFKKDGVWIGKKCEHFIIPRVKTKYESQPYSSSTLNEEKKVPIKPWLKFFGFWLASGWVSEDGNYNICLHSRDNDTLTEMKNILENFGYTVHIHGNTLQIRDFQLYNYLKQISKDHEKFIPIEIKMLSKNLLKIFFKYFIKGSSHKNGRAMKSLSVTTISKSLRDDLQEIALKIGISAYYKLCRKKGNPINSSTHTGKNECERLEDSWVVRFTRKNLPSVSPSTGKKHNHVETWVDYDGYVYCVEVPNHVIYVRRNGIPVWCGNSDPPMNWRVSALDKYTLLSFSDAHSPYPYRLGREAVVFELKHLSYREIVDAIKSKDPSRIAATVEVNPAYGKGI